MVQMGEVHLEWSGPVIKTRIGIKVSRLAERGEIICLFIILSERPSARDGFDTPGDFVQPE